MLNVLQNHIPGTEYRPYLYVTYKNIWKKKYSSNERDLLYLLGSDGFNDIDQFFFF